MVDDRPLDKRAQQIANALATIREYSRPHNGRLPPRPADMPTQGWNAITSTDYATSGLLRDPQLEMLQGLAKGLGVTVAEMVDPENAQAAGRRKRKRPANRATEAKGER